MQMIPENSDPVALNAQADIHRFYVRVIQPALEEFVPVEDVAGLETTDLDLFLEAARQNAHNALCHEMRRTFSLIVGALFERQLRLWLSGKMRAQAKEIEKEKWPELVARAKIAIGPAMVAEMVDLETLWSVANAVRHGNGRAATKLLAKMPQFWNQARRIDKSQWKSDLVGNMRIGDGELQKYMIAVLRFWHKAGASQVPIV
jgi:hypothetical protein